MALLRLSEDVLGTILVQLFKLQPSPTLAVYFISACRELRELLMPVLQQQLKKALCLKVGASWKALREAREISWVHQGLSMADLTTLGTLGSVLPELEDLRLVEYPAGANGGRQLAEKLGAGALPGVTSLRLGMPVGNAGASALAAALDRGALPRLKVLALSNAAIGDAGLAALAPALRWWPALESLSLWGNPLGDEGLAALVAPAPLAGARRRRRRPAAGGRRVRALPPAAGGLKRLRTLDLGETQVTDAGCAALAAALYRGALPALENLYLDGIPASAAAKQAAQVALARSRMARSE